MGLAMMLIGSTGSHALLTSALYDGRVGFVLVIVGERLDLAAQGALSGVIGEFSGEILGYLLIGAIDVLISPGGLGVDGS